MSDNYRVPGEDNPLGFMLNEAFEGVLRGLMVCLPGRVMAFDPETQQAQVQCGIRQIINDQPTTMPVIENVPVQFAGDSQWYFWHQITPGETEGLIHFSQRAVETWINSGGVTTPVDFRMFNAADAFFAPGFRSEPGAIPSFTNDGCGMSSYDGSTSVHLTSGHIEMSADSVNISSSTLTHNGTNVGDTHIHPQPADSDGNSQEDTGPPQ